MPNSCHMNAIHAGLVASSIQWGAWGGTGMVAHSAAVLTRMRRAGIDPVTPTQGLAVLAGVVSASQSGPQATLSNSRLTQNTGCCIIYLPCLGLRALLIITGKAKR